jgi:TolB-like protein
VLLAVGAAATARYWLAEPATQPPPSPSSVAVLPFENLSPDHADAYLAVAMQDELVSQLTKIGGLRVVPVRPGTAGPPDIPDLARGLNVASVLYGSVYHAEGRVRVTPRLTDTASVSLWSDSYERGRGDIFGIQADIALEVARALRLEPSAAERENVRRVPTTNQRAHDSYLSAKALVCCWGGLDDLMEALADIEQALALDPAFKEAWVAKAYILLQLALTDAGHAKEHHRLSQQAALRALELDPGLGAAYSVLGQVLAMRSDWRGAELAFRKARSLNESAAVMGAHAYLQFSAGKFGPVARDMLEEVRVANPRSPVVYRLLMFVYEVLGEPERARVLYADALRMFPGDNRESRLLQNQRMHLLIGRNELAEARAIPLADPFNSRMLSYLDAPEHALAELRQALGAYDLGAYGPEYPTRYYDIGLWAGHFGDPALAFEAMRKLADTGGGRMAFAWMPQLAAMRRLPEFKAYLREIGMVAYWQEFGWPPFCRQTDASDFECN